MKCEKCSTPIISGETRCRFCGFTNASQQNVEIIDEQPEIIEPEEMMDQIIDIEQPKVIKGKKIDLEDIIEAKKEIDINDELEKTTNLQKINIEDFTGRIEKEEVEEIKEKFKEIKNTKKDLKENKKATTVPAIKPSNIKEETKFTENANLYISIGVLTLLVLVFGISTGYLFINRNVFKKINDEKISTSVKGVFFDKYELTLPDNWLQKNEKDKDVLMIFDETYEWATSIQVVKDVDYTKIDEKKEEISSNYSKNRYIFTSNYTKTVNDKEFFLYKGKYDSYSVYLIINKMDNNTVLVSDLKFKGEVDKNVLDEILKSISEIKSNDLEKLYETNFDFSKTGDILEEEIKSENQIG